VSLRELIEAKQRRTAKWPLLVGNPSAAAADVESARRALVLHEEALDRKKQAGKKPTVTERKRGEELRADLKAAVDRFGAVTVDVELQALPDDEWEALFDPLEEDANGEIDMSSILAPLLAASCTAPELQEEQWWAEQLRKPSWTDGDKAALSRTFLELNTYAPRFDALGKG
jgi:hypothetical protein